jgi:hypothetical protein
MAETREVKIRVGAETTGGGQVDTLREKIEKLNHSVKAEFGGRSIFKDLGELAVGGGAVAGLSFLTARFAEAAKQAEEIATQFRRGELAAGDFVDRLARAVPILGNIYSAGRAIREMLTGEKEELAEILAQAARLNALIDQRAKLATTTAAAVGLMNQTLGGLKVEGSQIGAKFPLAEWIETQKKLMADLRSVSKESQDLIGKQIAGAMLTVNGKQMSPDQRLRELQRQLSDLGPTLSPEDAYVRAVKDPIGHLNDYSADRETEKRRDAIRQEIRQVAGLIRERDEAVLSVRSGTIDQALQIWKNFALRGADLGQTFAGQFMDAVVKRLADEQTRVDKSLDQFFTGVEAGADRQEANRKSLAELHRQITEGVAAGGDPEAVRAAEYLRIETAIADQRERLRDILNDVYGTEEQRVQAQRELNRLGAEEAVQKGAVDRDLRERSSRDREDFARAVSAGAPFFESRFGTGRAQAESLRRYLDALSPATPAGRNPPVDVGPIVDVAREILNWIKNNAVQIVIGNPLT